MVVQITDLALLLVKYILSYDNIDNLDRICFSLTCKRYYYEREKYLILKTLKDPYYYINGKPTLNSYHNLFQLSIERSRQYDTLALTTSNIKTTHKLPLINYAYVEKDFEIDANIKKICIYIHDSSHMENIKKRLNVAERVEEVTFFFSKIDQPIDSDLLPRFLVSLDLGSTYNLPLLPKVLPKTLKKLIFGGTEGLFNHPIGIDVLPNSLEELIFSGHFNHPLTEGALPGSLRLIVFGKNFSQEFDKGVLPPNLKSLTLGEDQQNYPTNLPSSLEILKFSKGGYARFVRPTSFDETPRLHTIHYLPIVFAQYLPASVTTVSFSDMHFTNDIVTPGLIPPTIRNINFGIVPIILDVPGIIPSSVTHLNFGNAFNSPLKPGVVPESVRVLRLGRTFSKPISIGDIPEGVEEIYFGPEFKFTIHPTALPSSIKVLDLNQSYLFKCDNYILPPKLEYLVLGKLSIISDVEIPQTLKSITVITYASSTRENLKELFKMKSILPQSTTNFKIGQQLFRKIDQIFISDY